MSAGEVAAKYRIESQDSATPQPISVPHVGHLHSSPAVQWEGLVLPRWIVERNPEFFRRHRRVSMVLPRAEDCINCEVVDNCNWHASDPDPVEDRDV